MNKNTLFLSLSQVEQDQALTEALVTAYRNTGKSADGRFFPETISRIKDIITKFYPDIKAATIASVFERGSLGMLGDFYGLTPKTFNGWLNAGYISEHHIREFDKKEKSRQSTESDMLNLLDILPEYIKKNPDAAAYDGVKIYAYLRYKDIIPFGYSDGFLKKAEQKAKTDAYRARRGEKVRVISEFVGRASTNMQALAESMAVADWLLSLHEQGKRASDVITSRMSVGEWKANGFHLPSVQYRDFVRKTG